MDPIVSLLDAMAPAAAPGPFLVGKVLRAGQGQPLQVEAAGLEPLEPEDLWVSPTLNWTWARDEGEPELLRPGDRVVLLSSDMQTYYLIAKAVHAGG